MAEPDKRPVKLEELLVSSLAQTDALARLLIEKGLITREELMEKVAQEPGTYQRSQKGIAESWPEKHNSPENRGRRTLEPRACLRAGSG